MSLEGWKSFFEIGGVVLLLLTFAFGAGALIVNNRLNAIQAQELGDFKLKFEEEQQKTAGAQKEAAEAKQIAGGFERDIAHANEKAAESGEKAAKANQEAAEANKTAETERLERLKLEAQIAPRRLTGAQQQALANAAKIFKGRHVKVLSYSLDIEGGLFAEQIIASLKLGGLSVDDGAASQMPLGSFSSGVHVYGSEKDLMEGLAASIASLGLTVVTSNSDPPQGPGVSTFVPSDAKVTILVGIKPLK
jgi:hypothetical protein